MPKGELLGHGARADVFAWDKGRALKLFWEGTSPAGVAGEAFAAGVVHQLAAAGGGRPAVPACFGTVTVEGRPGIIYERVDGPTMGAYAHGHPWMAARMGRQAAALHVATHEIAVPELPEYETQRQRLERSIGAAAGLAPAVREAALRAAGELPEDSRLCHGDFHPGNIILSARGPVVIDWPDARRGHPAGDVARTLLLLGISPLHASGARRIALAAVVDLFRRAYLGAYARLRPLDMGLVRVFLPVWAAARLSEGFPPEDKWLRSLASRLTGPA